jgi:hypothetical protein
VAVAESDAAQAGRALDHSKHPTADSELGSQGGLATTTLAPAEGLGSWIGPYKLLQKLGEGGMGTVYMAEQYQPVKRRVALANKAEVLLGSQASEQELDRLAAAGRLRQFRFLHFATHGQIDPVSASRSALLLANDRLPDEVEQTHKGQKVYTGRLTVETMSKWQLDADLVTLSACETFPAGAYSGLGR